VGLAVLAVALALLELPRTDHGLVLALWILLTPLGILLGAKTYMRRFEASKRPIGSA
jgi:hypothetical protein